MERSLTLAQRAFSLAAAAVAVVGVASVVHFGVSVRSHVRWAPKDEGGGEGAPGGADEQAPFFRMPAEGDVPAAAAAAAAAADRMGSGGSGGGALAPRLPSTVTVAPGDAARDAASGSSKP